MPFRTDYTDAIFAEINLKPEFICFKIHHVAAVLWGFPHPVLPGTLHQVQKMFFVSTFFERGEGGKSFLCCYLRRRIRKSKDVQGRTCDLMLNTVKW